MKFPTFNFLLSNIIVLVFVTQIHVVIASLDNDIFESFECSTQYKTFKPIPNFRFNCSIVSVVSLESTRFDVIKSGCTNFDYRSLTVNSYHVFKSVNFMCSSNYAITVDVKFADGLVMKEYLNMTWSREVVNFSDSSTYTYHLKIFPPQLAVTYGWGDSVWYTFSSMQNPSETIDVLWISATQPLLELNRVYIANLYNIYWMEDKRELDNLKWTSNGDAIYIPCISPLDMQIEKYGDNNDEALRYNATSFGIYMYANENKTKLLGNYRCFNYLYKQSSLNFSIVYRPNDYSSSYNIYYNDSDVEQTKVSWLNSDIFNSFGNGYGTRVIFDKTGMKFTLKCQSRDNNLTIIRSNPIDSTAWTKCDSTTVSTIDRFDNHTVNTAVCTTTGFEVNDTREFKCVNLQQGHVLAMWIFLHMRDLNRDYEYMPTTNELKCFSYGADSASNVLKDEYCSNPITCKLTEKLLTKLTAYNAKVLCPSDHSFEKRCSVTKLSNKGVFYCSTWHQTQWKYDKFNVHFLGLNQQVYIGITKEPPKEAIIQIKNLGSSEQTMINNHPVNFTFFCEAHSFYFEEGMQWLFEYSNGTIQHIPAENISNNVANLPPVWGEKNTNPSSSVNISVSDNNINRIICAAPRLSALKLINFKKWEFAGLDIAIYDAIAPSLVDTPSKYSFEIGEQNKDIKCLAAGLPKPIIQWSTISGQILPKQNVIDISIYSILKFPTYNESNEGDYLCTAQNAVGNVTKTVSVRTKDSSVLGTKFVIILAAVFLVLLSVCAITVYGYIRKLKMKQSMEMEDILQLLSGKPANEDDTPDPWQIPYDQKWELEKHSFCIDQNKILGCGEFGIVYKGTIAKSNIDVAFKSIKSSGNMTHLKSLVSELKLLLYIGQHENIVELQGAYTQEIEKGIIYVGIEFCALGSLERHLRSNKGKFQKCPFLTSYFENSKTIPEQEIEPSEPSNYTVKTLLKWCSEIASAMDYLYSKKVIHGDLATRNVLLTADWKTKLTDFGLSRKTYNSDNYVKKGEDPLPWRWLAVESLLTKVFNVKTDVWAFGISLWEIFSLGEVPYPGISANMEFVAELERGLRNPRPKYASDELYDVMNACWLGEADERPSFYSLCLLFQNSLRNDNFQLNMEDMESTGPIEGMGTEYLELEEFATNDDPCLVARKKCDE